MAKVTVFTPTKEIPFMVGAVVRMRSGGQSMVVAAVIPGHKRDRDSSDPRDRGYVPFRNIDDRPSAVVETFVSAMIGVQWMLPTGEIKSLDLSADVLESADAVAQRNEQEEKQRQESIPVHVRLKDLRARTRVTGESDSQWWDRLVTIARETGIAS